MAQTYGGYALKTGSTPSETADAGFVVLSKQVTLQANGTGGSTSVDASLQLPPSSQILNLLIDTTVAHTSANAAIIIGSTLGGSEYQGSTNVNSKGRVMPTPSTAVDAWQDIGTNTTIYARIGLSSPSTAVGTTLLTVVYVQKR